MHTRRYADLERVGFDMLKSIPNEVWESDTTTFVDCCMGGGQIVSVVEKKLEEFGHSKENISRRVFGYSHSKIDIKYAEKMYGLIGKYRTGEPNINMKFDVIVGNPPYHEESDGVSTGNNIVFHKFIERFMDMEPTYMAMIIPARWYSGGKGLNPFRRKMLQDRHIAKLVDFPNSKDIFPDLDIKGGICYYIWDKNHDGDCEVTTSMNGSDVTLMRDLRSHETFIRWNEAISILNKVTAKGYNSFMDQVSTRKPFGLTTPVRPTGNGDVTLYARQVVGLIEREAITVNEELIDKWKVLHPKASEGSGVYPNRILSKPIVAPPTSACTETYIAIGPYETEEEATNIASYMRTKFFRFMVAILKTTQDAPKRVYEFVPALSMDIEWTDAALYEHFGFDNNDIDFIDAIVKEMP